MRVKAIFTLIVFLTIGTTQTQSTDVTKTKERMGHYRTKPGYSSGLGSSQRKSQRDESAAESGESGERSDGNNLRAQSQDPGNHNHPSTRNSGSGGGGNGGGGDGGGREGGGGGGGGDHGHSFPHHFSYGYSITDHDYDQRVQYQSRHPHPTPQHYFNNHHQHHQSPYDHHRGFQHYENHDATPRPEKEHRRAPPQETHLPRNRGLAPGHIGNTLSHHQQHATRTVIPVARFASPLPYQIGYSQPAAVTPFGFLPHVAAAPPFTYLAGPTPVIAPQQLSAVVASASHGAQIAIPVTVPVVDHINVPQESEDAQPLPAQTINE